uniref:Uncharacterized protein n=1 Tax=Kalanchoe fedtschenkoi TaxID=63787 RepID=A0A7N0ZWQ2_KALFE
MCFKATETISPSFSHAVGKLRSNEVKLRVPRLTRKQIRNGNSKAAADLMLWNVELYLQNKRILEANEKLRQRAFFLHQENTALTAAINIKFTGLHTPDNYAF